MELISDVTFNSSFPDKEIEKEKDVVLEEINSYLDNPADLIFDDFEELIFAGQTIGRNILGTQESVRSFSREKLSAFVEKTTIPIRWCSVPLATYPDEKLLKLFEKYFSGIVTQKRADREIKRWKYNPSSVITKKDTYQNHCIIGNVAYDIKDKRRMGMFLLNNIIGGQGHEFKTEPFTPRKERTGIQCGIKL